MVIPTLFQDMVAFADQFFPSPMALLRGYQFSPLDLATVQPTSSSLSTLDVLSYNINNKAVNSPTRRQRILDAMISSGADIILLQETNPAWEQFLLHENENIHENNSAATATALSSQYKHAYFHHPRPGEQSAGGCAILSKFPIVDKQVLDFTKDIDGCVFPALTCQVAIPILPSTSTSATTTFTTTTDDSIQNYVTIRLANVHLRPPVNLEGSAGLDTARITEPIRMAEIQALLVATNRACKQDNNQEQESAPVDSPVLDIIAGDFNEGDDGGALRQLASVGYKDALQQFVPRRKETHTWPFLNHKWTLRKRLDHILWQGEPRSFQLSKTTTTGQASAGSGDDKAERECFGCGDIGNDVCVKFTSDGKLECLHCGATGNDVRVEASSNDHTSNNGQFKLECIGCGVLSGYETGASDHQPVLARFAIMNCP